MVFQNAKENEFHGFRNLVIWHWKSFAKVFKIFLKGVEPWIYVLCAFLFVFFVIFDICCLNGVCLCLCSLLLVCGSENLFCRKIECNRWSHADFIEKRPQNFEM